MHYNQFSIDYIEAIKKNLNIDFDQDGKVVFTTGKIDDSDIVQLKQDLQTIWGNSESAIDVVRKKQDSEIQAGLFGLVDDLDLALKVGYLIADRIVLIDYLFERLLKKEPSSINRDHLQSITSALAALLPLVKMGRVVIIPNPFNWNKQAKQIIIEVAKKTRMEPGLMSLLNMLSITKELQLHPYTIAESESLYTSIVSDQIDWVDSIGRDAGGYAYAGLLGALLSERLLSETELKFALDVPLIKYNEIISKQNEFRAEYLNSIINGGSLNAQKNLERINGEVMDSIEAHNLNLLTSSAKALTAVGAVGGGAIGVLAAASVISAPIAIVGAALSFSASLTGLLSSERKGETPIISVFKRLRENG